MLRVYRTRNTQYATRRRWLRIFSKVPKSNFKEIPITLPPLPEQRAIAHILGTMDDKIDLNRRLAETLAAIERALPASAFR